MTPVALDVVTCWQLTLSLWHTCWIGLVVGMLAAAANRVLRSAPAWQRYWLNAAALAVMGACLPVSFAVIRATSQSAVPIAAMTAADSAPPSGRSAQESGASLNGLPSAAPFEQRDDTIATWESAARDDAVTVREVAPDSTPSRLPETLGHFVQAAAPYITAMYLIGFYAMLGKLIVAIYGGKRLRAGCRPVVDRNLLDMLGRQSQRLALRLVPVLACCERVAVPVVVGVIRPMILIPTGMLTGLSPDELGAVLTHELAHIRRYDHWLILVQRFLEAVLYFHPLAWYLSRQIHAERERCCDDLVVAAGGDRVVYARSLLRVAELRLNGNLQRHDLAALAADGQRPSQLRQRIARLLGDAADPHVRFRNRWPALLLGVVCTAALWIVTAGTWQLLAQTRPAEQQAVIAVVEWSAVVDEEVMDEIRQLNAAEKKQPADGGTLSIHCSAEALRNVIKSHLEQKSLVALGNRIEFIGPSQPSLRKLETAQAMANSPIIQNGSRPLLPAWGGGGQISLEQQPRAAGLKLKLNFSFSAASESKNADFKFDDSLDDGRAVGFVVTMKGDEFWKPSLIVVYEAVQVPGEQMDLFRPMHQTPDWIRLGPGGVKKRMARAVAWRVKSKRSVTVLDPEWTHDLPNGGHVQLVALSRPKMAPLIWWDPAGRPISGVKPSVSYRDQDLVALVRVWETGARRGRGGLGSVLELVDKAMEKSGTQFVIVPAVLANAEGRPSLSVGAGFGTWSASAQLPAQDDATATLDDNPIRIQKLFKFDRIYNNTSTHLNCRPLKDFELRLDAVDRNGKEIAPRDDPTVQANEPQPGIAFNHEMTADDIDHFIIRSRPCHWTKFTGFAVEPAEPLEPPLDFSSDDEEHAANDIGEVKKNVASTEGENPADPLALAAADKDNEKNRGDEGAAPAATLPRIAERAAKNFEAIKTAHIKFRCFNRGGPFKEGTTPERCRELLAKYDLVQRPDELRDLIHEITDDEQLRAGRPWSLCELHVAGRKIRESRQSSERAPDIHITDGQVALRWGEANSQVNIDWVGQSRVYQMGPHEFWLPFKHDNQREQSVVHSGGQAIIHFPSIRRVPHRIVVDETTGFWLSSTHSSFNKVSDEKRWYGWKTGTAGIPYPTVVTEFHFQEGQLVRAGVRVVDEMRLNEPLPETIFQLGAPAGSTIFDSRNTAVISGGRINHDVFDVTSAEQLSEAAKPVDPQPKTPQEKFAVAELQRLYALADDEVLKRIGPPYPASRKHLPKLLGERFMTARRDIRSDCIAWNDGKLGDSWPYAGGSYRFQTLITYLLKLKPTEIEGDAGLLNREIPGDFVHRVGAPADRLAESLAEIASLEFQRPIRLAFREVERPVYLARGELKLALAEGQKAIALNGGPHSGDHGEGISFGNLEKLLQDVASYIHVPVINETQASRDELTWSSRWYDLPGTKPEKRFKMDPPVVLRQITEQTGITFTKEQRTVRLLFAEDDVP